MSNTISTLLDKAKQMHKLPSDYKLALVMGIDQKSLRNYRAGRLPDARAIKVLCDLTGDDSALLLIEIEEQRAKTLEEKTLWQSIAQRLAMTARQGVVTGIFSVATVGALLGVSATETHAQVVDNKGKQDIHCGMSLVSLKRRKQRKTPKKPVNFHQFKTNIRHKLKDLKGGLNHVLVRKVSNA